MVKKKYAFGINLLTVFTEIFAFVEIINTRKHPDSPKLPLAAFYTQLSNMTVLLASLLFLLNGRKSSKEWIAWLRYLSCCMLTLTFTVVMLVLIPMGDDPKYLLLRRHSFIQHVFAPVVTLASYILWETHPEKKSAVWLPVGVTVIYGLVLLALNAAGKVDGPYGFLKVRQQGIPKTIMWVVILVTAIFGMSKGIGLFKN